MILSKSFLAFHRWALCRARFWRISCRRSLKTAGIWRWSRSRIYRICLILLRPEQEQEWLAYWNILEWVDNGWQIGWREKPESWKRRLGLSQIWIRSGGGPCLTAVHVILGEGTKLAFPSRHRQGCCDSLGRLGWWCHATKARWGKQICCRSLGTPCRTWRASWGKFLAVEEWSTSGPTCLVCWPLFS